MQSFSSIRFPQFKSPLRILARFWFRSRNRWRAIAQTQKSRIRQLHQQVKQQNHQLKLLNGQFRWRQSHLDQPLPQPNKPTFPWQTAKPLPGHQYSPLIIALCCRLCLIVGFRATPSVLRCVSDALGLSLPIPSRDAVRTWNCRNGVAVLREPTPAPDWIWMIDHSVQLGRMCVLVVLGIRQADLPAGRPLRREDMSVLAVLPSESRKKEEVGRQLHQVAEDLGVPRAVLCDGAAELQEAVASLRTREFSGVCLADVKHKIANLLKKELGADPRYQSFEAQLGKTTAAIQQTELEHLLPPRKKQKCRFMNFDRVIDWAREVQAHLGSGQETGRIRQKLGWVSDFASELEDWQQMRTMIGQTLRQANHQGVWRGATEQLEEQLKTAAATNERVKKIREGLVEIVAGNETQLEHFKQAEIHLPCSTEVLESAFGSFKALQVNQNRGAFTSLLATFPTLFDDCTAEKIRERFGRVSNRDVAAWVEQAGLGDSTQSRRMKARMRRNSDN